MADETGETELAVPLGEGFSAEEREGLILVNGEALYTQAGSLHSCFTDREHYAPLLAPLTVKLGAVRDGGKTVVYRVRDTFRQTLCRGDVQRCAIGVLKVLLRLNGGTGIKKDQGANAGTS